MYENHKALHLPLENRQCAKKTLGLGTFDTHILAGTNDWTTNSATPAVGAARIWQNLAGEIQTLKRAGCVVFVSTMYSRYGNDSGSNTFDADHDAYNATIRQTALAAGAYLDDQAANPLIGADGAATSAGNTYFQSGGLHLTQAGSNLAAAEMSATLNYYFGTTAGYTRLITATYSMLSGDAFALISSPAAATVVTLPDCLGPTGATYTISNPQSAQTVTLKNLISIEPINGVDYSSTGLTIASNTTKKFTIIALPSSTGGCAWVSTQ